MQLIAEAYDLLKTVGGMTNKEISKTFETWNKGPLASFLVELTAQVLKIPDDRTNEGFLVDKILDKTGMKGTGKWTVQDALELGVAVPTISAAFDGRLLSGLKEQRERASETLGGISAADTTGGSPIAKEDLVEMVEKALLASKIVAYAQGMSILSTASERREWSLDLSKIARIWKGGCIIRAELLNDIQEAYKTDPTLPNLLLDPTLAKVVSDSAGSWRAVVAAATARGVAIPAISASLGYYDAYRRADSPANLVQAQRDAFGAHGYERKDMEGSFTSDWLKETEIK
mmetsp:Transcript_20687/g.38910  ORF Transcript_20687/g.38910 Transcript_20687/m.38910 type:complete len:288 (-) Transcript_20687:325-1188(-)